MIIDVLTIFPQMFKPIIGESMVKRAQEKGLLKIHVHDLRDYSLLPHKKVDAPSFGGGPGMVIRPEAVFNAAEDILGYNLYPRKKRDSAKRIIFFTPQGNILNQRKIKKFFKFERLILIAGRYEGVDQRLRSHLVEEEVSIGDYVLSGGELPAMIFIDMITRIIPGVVSCPNSIKKESFENNLLDHPHYTKPRDFRGLKVPAVLLSGDHKRIEAWRKEKALAVTKKRRKDLLMFKS
ncbi:MAG: tRNA (guanosine(37)-N1)-methyltransferase TrmD [Candidatus Omnitrophota bacterium]